MVSSMVSSRFGEGFRRPSNREDIGYLNRGGLESSALPKNQASLESGSEVLRLLKLACGGRAESNRHPLSRS